MSENNQHKSRASLNLKIWVLWDGDGRAEQQFRTLQIPASSWLCLCSAMFPPRSWLCFWVETSLGTLSVQTTLKCLLRVWIPTQSGCLNPGSHNSLCCSWTASLGVQEFPEIHLPAARTNLHWALQKQHCTKIIFFPKYNWPEDMKCTILVKTNPQWKKCSSFISGIHTCSTFQFVDSTHPLLKSKWFSLGYQKGGNFHGLWL